MLQKHTLFVMYTLACWEAHTSPMYEPNCNTHSIQRDVAVRGRDVGGVLEQYQKFVKPAFDSFVAPSRRHADVIIPWTRYANGFFAFTFTAHTMDSLYTHGWFWMTSHTHSVDNYVAIDLITEHIRLKLQQPDLKRIHHNLEVIPSNFQIRGMHTIIRDQETQTNDFVFYVRRM